MTAEMTENKPTQKQARIASALLRYRILAWSTGTVLLLFCLEIIANHLFGIKQFWWIAIVHGYLYLVFAFTILDLSIKVRWQPTRILLSLISGVVPGLSFYAEHKATQEIRTKFDLS